MRGAAGYESLGERTRSHGRTHRLSAGQQRGLAGSLVHLGTSGVCGGAAFTSSHCEPEQKAEHDEDDDGRHAGHEQEVERAHAITCVISYAPVRARNADAAMSAGTTAMKRRFKRSLLSWVVEQGRAQTKVGWADLTR